MNASDDPEMRALDAALAAALAPPELPPDFERQLAARLEDPSGQDWGAAAREALERERAERLAELEAGYIRVRRRTLGTWIGGSFAAGAAAALGLPWLQAAFGANVLYAVAGAGALVGIALVVSSLGATGVAGALARLLP